MPYASANALLQLLVKQLLSSSPNQRPSAEEVLGLPFLRPALAVARALAASIQVLLRVCDNACTCARVEHASRAVGKLA